MGWPRRSPGFAIAVVAVALVLAPGARGQGSAEDSAFFRLENGLEVLIERVPDAQAMALFLFVKSGWAQDPPKGTGLAHLTEHLVMTAVTPTRGEVWPYARWNRERLAANAMTRPAWTVFYSIGRREELSEDARRLADVLAGKAELTEPLFLYERGLMLQETMNMTDYVPGGVLQWRGRALALAGEPAGRQGIGVRDEVIELTLEDLRGFYRAHYRPDNALLVAVGRVDPVLDRPFYEEVFGPLASGPTEPARQPIGGAAGEPVVAHARVGGVFASYVFRAPSPTDDAFPAFVLAAFWLCAQAQRDFQPRGHEGLGFFLPGLYPLLEDPQLMFINRRGESEQTLEDTRKELDEWLARTTSGRIREPNLIFARLQVENLLDPLPRSKARARLVARQPRMLYQLGLARGVSRLGSLPDDLWMRIRAVTAAEVEEALRSRFTAAHRTFVALTPPPK